MKKVFICCAVVVTLVLTASLLHGTSFSVEHLENGKIGVETLVQRTFDLEDMTFTCSAVFQVEKSSDIEAYCIKDITSQFIQRKKAPNGYTFSTKDDVRTIEVEPGICYELKQIFIVSRNGDKIGTLDVGAQFYIDPDTGEMAAKDVMISQVDQ